MGEDEEEEVAEEKGSGAAPVSPAGDDQEQSCLDNTRNEFCIVQEHNIIFDFI